MRSVVCCLRAVVNNSRLVVALIYTVRQLDGRSLAVDEMFWHTSRYTPHDIREQTCRERKEILLHRRPVRTCTSLGFSSEVKKKKEKENESVKDKKALVAKALAHVFAFIINK